MNAVEEPSVTGPPVCAFAVDGETVKSDSSPPFCCGELLSTFLPFQHTPIWHPSLYDQRGCGGCGQACRLIRLRRPLVLHICVQSRTFRPMKILCVMYPYLFPWYVRAPYPMYSSLTIQLFRTSYQALFYLEPTQLACWSL